MHHPHVSGQRIIARDNLLLRAKKTSYFLLACIVTRILKTCKIVRPGEDRIARLAGAMQDQKNTIYDNYF